MYCCKCYGFDNTRNNTVELQLRDIFVFSPWTSVRLLQSPICLRSGDFFGLLLQIYETYSYIMPGIRILRTGSKFWDKYSDHMLTKEVNWTIILVMIVLCFMVQADIKFTQPLYYQKRLRNQRVFKLYSPISTEGERDPILFLFMYFHQSKIYNTFKY